MEKYKLTTAEIEGLVSRGFDLEEIESAEIIVYRCEDWVAKKFQELDFKSGLIDAFYFNEKGERTQKGMGDLVLFVYPPSERVKINQCKEEKLEAFVKAYYEALVETFEIQEKASKEPLLLAESELDKVIDLIGDKFPMRTNGVIYSNLTESKFPSIWLQYRNDCGEKANLSYWFKKICVRGENGLNYVGRRHITLTANELNSHHPDHLHFVVSALAFHRFKGYLTAKINGSKQFAITEHPLIKIKALEYLKILSGLNMYGRKIMPNDDFERLEGYVKTMIEMGRLPDGLSPISKVDFPNGHIRFLFRCIHAEQYAERKIQEYFIDFLHTVFPQFTGIKETTKHKFGEQPTTWERDLEKMKGG